MYVLLSLDVVTGNRPRTLLLMGWRRQTRAERALKVLSNPESGGPIAGLPVTGRCLVGTTLAPSSPNRPAITDHREGEDIAVFTSSSQRVELITYGCAGQGPRLPQFPSAARFPFSLKKCTRKILRYHPFHREGTET